MMKLLNLLNLRWPTDLARLRRWGWPGAVGALMLALGTAVLLWQVPLEQQSQAQWDSRLRQARAAARLARSPLAAPTQAADPQAQFLAAFPPQAQRQQRLAAVWALAQQQSLVLRRSEFRASADERLGLARYRISLPLEGSYSAVRAFIESALLQDPALSVDRLRLDRSEPGSPTVRAELQLSLWSRQPVQGS
jgi:transcriptional regulator with GAF, ATPase, and Fis domain